MADEKRMYLGDGLYVYTDSHGQVVLVTSNGIEDTNMVYLEPGVLSSFLEWLKARGMM